MARTIVIAMLMVAMARATAAAEDQREPWKPVFFGSLALTVGAGAFWVVSVVSVDSEADQIVATKPNGARITHDDCSDRVGITGDTGGHFDSACAWRSRSRTALIFGIGFGVATLASAYFAFRGDAPSTGDVAITPTLSRDGAGAHLQLHW